MAGLANITGMTIVHTFPYRAESDEDFTNTYWLSVAVPATTAQWDTIRDNLLASTRPLFPSTVKFLRVIGYDSSEPGATSVYSYDWPAGSLPVGAYSPAVGEQHMAGDQAACIEWQCDLKSVKGKPVFLRKYMHSGYVEAGTPDNLGLTYLAALQQHARDCLPGGAIGGLRSPHAQRFAVSEHVIPYVTTRTLKRRGKRKRPV
jgi:hypothetical protein